MPRRHRREISLTEVVRQCERWPTNVVWPAPIDERLNGLLDLAVEAGEADSLTRSELIAALVLAAPADGDKLAALLRGYRKAKVCDAVIKAPGQSEGRIITLRDRKPGRR